MHVDHIAIACRDVELMRAWYERVLGFEVRARKVPSRPDATAPTYLVGPPSRTGQTGSSASLELTPDDRLPGPGRKPFTAGIAHIALAVEDFGQWEARLSTMEVRWTGPAGEAVGGGKVRSFLDPEGNQLQIVERKGR